jgi:hypothetical protein
MLDEADAVSGAAKGEARAAGAEAADNVARVGARVTLTLSALERLQSVPPDVTLLLFRLRARATPVALHLLLARRVGLGQGRRALAVAAEGHAVLYRGLLLLLLLLLDLLPGSVGGLQEELLLRGEISTG